MKLVLRIGFLLMVIIVAFSMWLTQNHEIAARNEQMHEDATKSKEQVEETNILDLAQKQMVHIKRKDGSEAEIELETYLQGVVGSEMKASFCLEALKAQAVAARTFVASRNYEVDDSTASQVYQDEEQLHQVWQDHYEEYHAKIEQAVNETKGKVLTYEGNYITAAFFSSCNGFTNNSEDYWQGTKPYLRSVESPWDLAVEGNQQTVTITREELANQLGFTNPVVEISQPLRYDNGYVKQIQIDGILFTGRELRERLNLRSSAFDIDAAQDIVSITTYGFGHGIGMSQYGANAMAEDGAGYEEILKHYYTGVEISDL